MTDTPSTAVLPPAQDAAPYAARVAAIDDVRAAQDRIEALEQQVRDAKRARKEACWRAVVQDGMSAPAVAASIGTDAHGKARVSVSTVQQAVRWVEDLRAEQDGDARG